MVSVQRLSVRASLDDSPAALAHARAQTEAGDESWEQWVAEYQRGEALILRLELTLEVLDGTGDSLTVSKDGFFVENDVHAPKVEQQIAELASGDLGVLAAQLAQRGHELDPEVRRRVADRSATV